MQHQLLREREARFQADIAGRVQIRALLSFVKLGVTSVGANDNERASEKREQMRSGEDRVRASQQRADDDFL